MTNELVEALARVSAYISEDSAPKPERKALKEAIKLSLGEVSRRAPGHSVELRVPPYAAVQCIEGPRHTRGTPPNVVEVTSRVWLRLAVGDLNWNDALSSGQVDVSGNRASEVGSILPLMSLPLNPGS